MSLRPSKHAWKINYEERTVFNSSPFYVLFSFFNENYWFPANGMTERRGNDFKDFYSFDHKVRSRNERVPLML